MGGVRHLRRARSVVKLEDPLRVCVRLTCSEPCAAAPGCQSDRRSEMPTSRLQKKARSQPRTADSSARLPPIHALISYLFFFFFLPLSLFSLPLFRLSLNSLRPLITFCHVSLFANFMSACAFCALPDTWVRSDYFLELIPRPPFQSPTVRR